MTQLLAAAGAARAPLAAACLQHSRTTDAALALLPAAFGATLASLQLAYCRAVGDAGLAAVTALPALVSLDLYQVPSVSPGLIAELVT